LEQPKIDLQEATTFHNGEENELEDVTKNTWLKTIWPTINHPLELRCIKIELETPMIWDLIENKVFWYHEIVMTSPHAKEKKWLTLEAN
jgi:hypothetical protein